MTWTKCIEFTQQSNAAIISIEETSRLAYGVCCDISSTTFCFASARACARACYACLVASFMTLAQ